MKSMTREPWLTGMLILSLNSSPPSFLRAIQSQKSKYSFIWTLTIWKDGQKCYVFKRQTSSLFWIMHILHVAKTACREGKWPAEAQPAKKTEKTCTCVFSFPSLTLYTSSFELDWLPHVRACMHTYFRSTGINVYRIKSLKLLGTEHSSLGTWHYLTLLFHIQLRHTSVNAERTFFEASFVLL